MKVYTVETGFFKLDGGAMFGVVPKKMWNKIYPSDSDNMCTWAMRCLLIVEGERKILIDTGLGDKQDAKFRSHFSPHGEASLLKSLKQYGFEAEEITDVLITHMHFDHVGGAVIRTSNNDLIPTFPNAVYWTNEQHHKWALDPNPREKASFLKENIVPLSNHNVLKYIDVEQGVKFSDSITIEFVYGHTEAMMIPTITLDNGNKIIYAADLMPSHGHVGLPYVMAFDIRPLVTMKERKDLHEKVLASNNTFIYFEHDKDISIGKLIKNEKGRVVFGGEVSINEIES